MVPKKDKGACEFKKKNDVLSSLEYNFVIVIVARFMNKNLVEILTDVTVT